MNYKKLVLFLMPLLLVATVSALDLGDYPDMFIEGDTFNGVIVVGDAATAEDVIGATDIATSLQYLSEDSNSDIVTVRRINVASTKLASEITDAYNQNMILVGQPKRNSVNGNELIDQFYSGSLNSGLIKLIRNGDYYILIVTGDSPSNVRQASQVLANYGDYNLDGTEYEVGTASVQLCTDSDGGIDYYEKGEITEYTILVPDYCIDSSRLKELYCSNGRSAETTYTCPSGCREGACVIEGGKPNLIIESISLDYSATRVAGVPSYTYTIYVKNIGNTAASQSRLKTVVSPKQAQRIDVGNANEHYSMHGGATAPIPMNDLISGDLILPGERERFTEYINPSQEGWVTIEAIADTYGEVSESNEGDNKLKKEFYVKKIFDIKAECSDSDGGKEYYIKGMADNRKNSIGSYWQDKCLSKDQIGEREWKYNEVYECTGNNCNLQEGYCDGDNVKNIAYKCPNGCRNGACVKNNVVLPPFTMAVEDRAPASDVILITDVGVKLQEKGYGNLPTGTTKLFSEVNALGLNYRVTLAVYKGEAVIIVGVNSPSSHVIFSKELAEILKEKGVEYRAIVSSEVPSSKLIDLFVTSDNCWDSDGGKNYYVRGTTKGRTFFDDDRIVSKTDYCVRLSGSAAELTECSGNDCGVYEFACATTNGQTFVNGNIKECGDGCKNGACSGHSDFTSLKVYGRLLDRRTGNPLAKTTIYTNSINGRSINPIYTDHNGYFEYKYTEEPDLMHIVPGCNEQMLIVFEKEQSGEYKASYDEKICVSTRKSFYSQNGVLKVGDIYLTQSSQISLYSDVPVTFNIENRQNSGCEALFGGGNINFRNKHYLNLVAVPGYSAKLKLETENGRNVEAGTAIPSDLGCNALTAGYVGGSIVFDVCGNNFCAQGEKYSCPSDCVIGGIYVNLNERFKLSEEQSAKVVDYKDMKITLNDIIKECEVHIESSSNNEGSSSGGGMGCKLIGAHVQVEMPGECQTNSPNEDCSSTGTEFIIRKGEGREVFGVEIKLLGLRQDVGEFIVKEEIQEDYVDVKIYPESQEIFYGDETSYKVVVTDKHAVARCVGNTGCSTQMYTYFVNVRNLPFNKDYEKQVTIEAGGSKTFTLKVFPYAVVVEEEKIEYDGEMVVTKVVASDIGTSSIETGNAVASEVEYVYQEDIPIRTNVYREYKFSVNVKQQGDPSVRDAAYGKLIIKPVISPPEFPTDEITIKLSKGWNLISLPGKLVKFSDNGCTSRKKLLGFVYLKEKQKYVTLKEAQDILGNDFRDYLAKNAFWIYSFDDCELKVKLDLTIDYSGINLHQGWNLIPITEDMVGGYLGDIMEDCNIQKINKWDAVQQEWRTISKEYTFSDWETSYGFIAKVSDYCSLGGVNILVPPAMPEE